MPFNPTQKPQHRISFSPEHKGISVLSYAIMHRRIRRVFTNLKERSRVSYAKIATIGGFCDIDSIIIKTTSPNDFPLPERYIHQILKIFSVSPSSFRAFSLSFTRRFGRTQSWKVALKCLLLLHRLLRSVPDESPLRSELLYARSNGLISLYPCRFRDTSSLSSEDYTKFIRSYAQLLDEALNSIDIDNISLNTATDENAEEKHVKGSSLKDKMKEVVRVVEVLPQYQSLIDRVMDCRPTGSASRSFIVHSAMKHIIRDSFFCYTVFRRDIVVVLDNLLQMPYRSCVSAFGIYKKAAVQANQLCEFYSWCRGMGLCGSYEYPYIDRIPKIHVQSLENILNGMWQLTESSSSTTSPFQSSQTSSIEDDCDHGQATQKSIVVSHEQWERFEEDDISRKFEEEQPLIQLEVQDNVSWEILLEKSISMAPLFPSQSNMFGYNTGKEMQIYNPYSNSPLPQQQYYGSSNPAYPWGL